MQMISIVFLLFLAAILVILLAVNRFLKTDRQRARASQWVLLISSFLFAAYGDVRFALVLALVSLISWACAGTKKAWILGIAAALAGLAYFKYTNFFLDTVGRLFGKEPLVLKLLLPLGISFYTFSAISYLVDVHRGTVQKQNLLQTALYLSFFPKLTSGPIARCGDFFSQTEKPRNICWENFSAGAQIFAFGLFKKLVLADHLSVFVNQVFRTPNVFSGLTVLLAVISYSLQIYLDFSGYSDIAIGAARMLDIQLPQNFNLPYFSHNVTEFWKRWHITLSSWLQDYLYIPLGGSRKGTFRAYLNLMIVMLLGGLWHGASWNYVIWGLLQGGALVVHKLWCRRKGPKVYNGLTACLNILFTYCYVCFTWVFFRAESFSQAYAVLKAIFTWKPGVFQPYFWLFVALICCAAAAIAAIYRSRELKTQLKKKNTSWVTGFYPLLDLNSFWGLTLFFVFCGLILGLAYTGGSPFIYGSY